MKTSSLFILALASFALLTFANTKTDNPSPAAWDNNTGRDQAVQTDTKTTVKKYQLKSGIVTFETTVAGAKGKEILYFEDYGTRELLEKYSGDKLKEVTLADGTTMYKIKPDQKTAYKMGNANRGLAYKFDWSEIPAADQGTKAKKLPNVTVAGKDCESYSYETSGITTIYAGWNNICLLTEQKMKFGTSVTKAVGIEVNAVIAADKFKIPAGFEVK